MPIATTFAGDSARAEGLFNQTISLGAGYWAATLTSPYVGAGHAYGNGITVDSSGNVYVSGNGSNSSNQNIASVSKYNSSGTIQWQRTITDAFSTPNSYANGIAVDSSGNVYVCGQGADSVGNVISMVSKYDSSGTIQWQRLLYQTSGTIASLDRCIAVDSSGNVYVGGNYNGNTINIIYKLNSSGIVQWQKYLDDGQSAKLKYVAFNGITLDSSGNIYVSGVGYYPNSTVGPTIAVCKYNNSGTLQWQKSLTDAYPAPYGNGFGITIDSSGNLYVCGNGSNSGGASISSISKWDNSGNIQWQRTLTSVGSTPTAAATGISIDSSNNVYVCGQGYNSSNQTVISISKWDSSGTIQFQRTITDNYSSPTDIANGIIVDSSGNMYVTGSIANTAGTAVMFITKLPTDGSRTGTYSNSTFGITYASSSWTAATSTWTAATSTYGNGASTLTEAASSWTNATSTWSTSLVVV